LAYVTHSHKWRISGKTVEEKTACDKEWKAQVLGGEGDKVIVGLF
jgi:hypothetical protein